VIKADIFCVENAEQRQWPSSDMPRRLRFDSINR